MATNMTDEEWKKKLSEQQYNVLRKKGTETPFTGKFLHNKAQGTYVCMACGEELFKSDHKFDSGTGWPSFYDIAKTGAVNPALDLSGGTKRIEVTCANCGGHLGHVFDDAPNQPTGKRYCVNSCALDFNPKR